MKGNVFGGYTSVSWTSNSEFESDSKAFLFSVNRKLKFPVKPSHKATYNSDNYGFDFGLEDLTYDGNN